VLEFYESDLRQHHVLRQPTCDMIEDDIEDDINVAQTSNASLAKEIEMFFKRTEQTVSKAEALKNLRREIAEAVAKARALHVHSRDIEIACIEANAIARQWATTAPLY
jgi:anaerobic ribonucleoside-triphosphate reductase